MNPAMIWFSRHDTKEASQQRVKNAIDELGRSPYALEFGLTRRLWRATTAHRKRWLVSHVENGYIVLAIPGDKPKGLLAWLWWNIKRFHRMMMGGF